MSTPTVMDKEIQEVIEYLRSKGQSTFANRVEALKSITDLGKKQYEAGMTAIMEVEKALTERVPRNLILSQIASVINEIKREL